MKSIYKFFLFSMLISIYSCNGTKNTSDSDHSLKWNIRAGDNWGGFIEETEVDAVSGATSVRLSGGAHISIPIRNNNIETGLDIIGQDQTLTYYDSEKNQTGKRTFKYTTVMLPVTFNWNVWRNKDNFPNLGIKIGLAGAYAFDPKTVTSGDPMAFEWNNF